MTTHQDFEYIVVGSGAGGGTVAARLAESGCKVLVLEAGGDPLSLQGGDAVDPSGNRLPDDYRVPVFHAMSNENHAMRWDFWVRHYGDDDRQRRDLKYRHEWEGETVDGVLYPRAGCLGGCTAHNAMITVYPHNDDWNHIAQLTGDDSWSADKMRGYFEKMERCRHRPALYRWSAKARLDPTRHGWNGWLQTEVAIPKAALGDKTLVKTLKESVEAVFKSDDHPFQDFESLVEGLGDPNDWRLVQRNATGLRYAPLMTRNHERLSTRERLLEVQARFPDRLTIELDALVTRIIFDGENRAVGVEYQKGKRLYQAHYEPAQAAGELRQVRASREIILAGGAFNTPQLLMLSGIGPKAELEKHGIKARANRPGVGTNLQDRYEVGVVNRMAHDWDVLHGARYAQGDPQYQEWATKRSGVYASNGAVLAVIRRSVEKRDLPDLFCFALLAKFEGYYPEFSKEITRLNYLTWAVLKAHTNNRGGEVRLKSADPRDRPYINFKYFEEGTPDGGEDLDSVVEGVKFVRSLTADLKRRGLIAEETVPGDAVQTDEQIRDFVRYQSWGHHASCTCPIGADDDPMAVLDSKFRVRGVRNLRVVDASVFPRIPGFFIVSAIYMIAEKAADEILLDR